MRSRSIALVLGALVGLRAAPAGAQEQGVDPLPVVAPIDATFMPTLRADGAQKVLEGLTTIEEVMRVTQEDLVVE